MTVGCRSCGDGPIVTDPDSGDQVCRSCGVIASSSSDNFVAQTFDSVGAPLLHFVNPSRTYHDRKAFHAESLVSDITSRLGLSASRSADVLRLVTDGSLGSGDWFPVLGERSEYSDSGAADARYFKVGERSELEDVKLSGELRNAVAQVALAGKLGACGKGDELGKKRKRGGMELDVLNTLFEEGRWDLDKKLS